MPTLTKNDGNLIVGLIAGIVIYRKFVQPTIKGMM